MANEHKIPYRKREVPARPVIGQFDTDGTQLDMFIGPLEAKVMRSVWAGHSTAPKVWRDIRDTHKTSVTVEIQVSTISTTLARLSHRKILTRKGNKRLYTYAPIHASESDFVKACMQQIIWALLREYPIELRETLRDLVRGDRNE